MKKIVLIIPYFGVKPDFYELWKMSALQNPSVDFLIITDIKELETCGNIHVVYSSLDEVKEKIQSCFPFSICMARAYKLCDYKPVYGLAFQELISDYDFWGHCDIDLIFGNIRKFITDDILEKYDKIYEHGHFCLYRNNDSMNRVFMMDGEYPEINYKETFQTEDIYAFDEFPGMIYKCRRLKIKTYLNTNDFYDVKTDEKAFSDAFHLDSIVNTVFCYDDGKLEACEITKVDLRERAYDKIIRREIMYMHFQKRRIGNIDDKLLADKQFYIIPNCLQPLNTSYRQLYRLNGQKIYKVKYKFNFVSNKIKQHIQRYKLLKKDGTIGNIVEYIRQRKNLNLRFAINRKKLDDIMSDV